MTRDEKLQAAFPGLTEAECRDLSLVILDGGRRLWIPTALYYRIRESGFNHGVRWADANPKDKRITLTLESRP